MSAAGSAQIAYVVNTGFDTLPGTPTYYRPGRNPNVTELSLSNQLQRLREEGSEEAVNSIAGNFEGAFNVEYTMSNDTHTTNRSIIFNDGGSGFTATSIAPTSTWFVGASYFDTSFASNVTELELRSCIPLNYSITYEQETNTIRESLNLAYADLNKNTSFTPGSITGPADGNDVPFHGLDLTINGSAVNREQSMTLSFDGPLYRYQRESDRNPANAVLANPTTSLESSVIYHTDDYLGLALGGSTSATSPQDTLSNVSGDVAFNVGGTTVATYSLSKLKVDEWQGADGFADPEADWVGTASWHVNGGISIS